MSHKIKETVSFLINPRRDVYVTESVSPNG